MSLVPSFIKCKCFCCCTYIYYNGRVPCTFGADFIIFGMSLRLFLTKKVLPMQLKFGCLYLIGGHQAVHHVGHVLAKSTVIVKIGYRYRCWVCYRADSRVGTRNLQIIRVFFEKRCHRRFL